MGTITTKDGTQIDDKDWGKPEGQPIVFSLAVFPPWIVAAVARLGVNLTSVSALPARPA